MLMRRWTKTNGRISAFHFDHNLEKSSLENHVRKSKKIKIKFKVKWNHEKIKTRIMERAEMRYENIINQCKK